MRKILSIEFIGGVIAIFTLVYFPYKYVTETKVRKLRAEKYAAEAIESKKEYELKITRIKKPTTSEQRAEKRKNRQVKNKILLTPKEYSLGSLPSLPDDIVTQEEVVKIKRAFQEKLEANQQLHLISVHNEKERVCEERIEIYKGVSAKIFYDFTVISPKFSAYYKKNKIGYSKTKKDIFFHVFKDTAVVQIFEEEYRGYVKENDEMRTMIHAYSRHSFLARERYRKREEKKLKKWYDKTIKRITLEERKNEIALKG